MSQEMKIKDEQLKSLQEKVGAIQQLQGQIGNVEGQKHILLHQLASAQDDLQKLQTSLQDEYGKVSINIQDGSYEKIVEEAEVEA